ncbi:serine hydrolase [Pontiellaceae bacterium B1224]|nr:serine hydrolase [Pontiellaceae bacterium B1224]
MKGKKFGPLRIIMLVVAVISIVSLAFVPWDYFGVWLAPLPDTVQQQVDDAMDHGLDGIIVYVDQSGTQPTAFSAGWKNRENKVPADPNALFKIASIDKLYVATAIAKLANNQTVSLDDTLADYFPELVGRIEHADRITLRMMVRHRSGIPNLTDHPDFPWGNPPQSSREALEYALDLPADFEPDKKYSYSNTNYLLLSEVIGQVMGESHHQYIKREILTPLGLTHTFGSLQDVDLDDVVSGYYIGWEPDLKMNHMGSMIASAEDVGIFLRALNDGSLLTEDEQAIYSAMYEYEHTGSLPGYSSIARYHKDLDAVVVQFVNTSGGDSWAMTELVYSRIVRILRRQYKSGSSSEGIR